MTASVSYHCPCLSTDPVPPPPNAPSSSYGFHPLYELFFCEECDAVRCNRCVSVEVSGYYCPNCLFEVPSASVRAEKNRCAYSNQKPLLLRERRGTNRFSPPPADAHAIASCVRIVETRFLWCLQTPRTWMTADPLAPISVRSASHPFSSTAVSADGTRPRSTSRSKSPPASRVRFFSLVRRSHGFTLWSVFTQLLLAITAQLQKFEDSAPESLEFERLKEHFEPFLRASSSSSANLSGHSHAAHPHSTPVNAITAAASSALARDIPGVGKYTPAPRGRRDKGTRDEIPEYRSRVEAAGTKEGANVDFMRRLEEVSQVAALGQRWANSWTTTLRSRYMRPSLAFLTCFSGDSSRFAQRAETPADTPPLQKDEALSGVSAYPHQA